MHSILPTSQQAQPDKHKLTQTHGSHRSYLQVGQPGRSLSSLGLCQTPTGYGCSPSTGHNEPSGRSGCRRNFWAEPVPPKTPSPCPTPSESPQQSTRRRPAWFCPPGYRSSYWSVFGLWNLSFLPYLHPVQLPPPRCVPHLPAAQRSWTTYCPKYWVRLSGNQRNEAKRPEEEKNPKPAFRRWMLSCCTAICSANVQSWETQLPCAQLRSAGWVNWTKAVRIKYKWVVHWN